MELFRRYDPAPPPEERKGSPVCMASYPEPCGERAVGEGWGCLPFCERHWDEAEMAAREELAYAVGGALDALIYAEKERPDRNGAVVVALFEAAVPAWRLEEGSRYKEVRAAAYPTEGREDPLTDPETAAYDYGHDGDGPGEWWADERYLLLRFMRQAGEKGLPRLMHDLEGLRERATVQEALAERDYELRYVAPGRRRGRRRNGRAGSRRPGTVPD